MSQRRFTEQDLKDAHAAAQAKPLTEVYPNKDTLPRRLGVTTTVGGTIEEAEERALPWLRRRRARRRG